MTASAGSRPIVFVSESSTTGGAAAAEAARAGAAGGVAEVEAGAAGAAEEENRAWRVVGSRALAAAGSVATALVPDNPFVAERVNLVDAGSARKQVV
jgi:hypothetical protein